MSLRKFNAVQSAYERLPKNNAEQLVHMDDIRSKNNFHSFLDLFSCKNHPEVTNRKRREDEILNEFILTFEENH
jgi:hypothetical protein